MLREIVLKSLSQIWRQGKAYLRWEEAVQQSNCRNEKGPKWEDLREWKDMCIKCAEEKDNLREEKTDKRAV